MTRKAARKARFHIRFEEAEKGAYVIQIPEMPGCVTEADTFQEGLVMVQDALEGLLEVATKRRDPIPELFQPIADALTSRSRAHGH
jgi:predicted RNase H-like HicB family nuclease